MCKHYNTPQGCSYGDKCQFAHGAQELRLCAGGMAAPQQSKNKMPNNYLNYKIVKCKNWEKDKTCKYGAHCTFAHGDEDLRNKADNMYPMGAGFPMMMPMLYDMSSLPMVMPQNPDMNLNLAQMQMMGQNPLMMNMMPINKNVEKNNNDNNNEKNQQ